MGGKDSHKSTENANHHAHDGQHRIKKYAGGNFGQYNIRGGIDAHYFKGIYLFRNPHSSYFSSNI